MPRAAALSPSHCHNVYLDLSMPFSALSVFKSGREKMRHF